MKYAIYIIDNSQFYSKLNNSPDASFLKDSLPSALNRWTYLSSPMEKLYAFNEEGNSIIIWV
ncbi:hypothetical protein PAAL109150_16470 [Paenibacillus alkaliterrae]